MISIAAIRRKCQESAVIGGLAALIITAVAFAPLLAPSLLVRTSLSISVYGAILVASYLGGRRAGWVAVIVSAVGGFLLLLSRPLPFVLFYLAISVLFQLLIVEIVARMNEAQKQAMAAADQNRTLFLELRHRVSNNLQMVASLLTLHEGEAQDAEGRRLFREAANRIHLIGKINRDLYEQGSTTVDARTFLSRLCTDLGASLATRPIECNIRADGRWDAKTLGPLSIIIQELVSNALEHGIDGKADGEVVMNFDVIDDERRLLAVADNGRGIPENFDPKATKSLGLKLVRAFAQQIGTKVEFKPRDGGGTVASLELPAYQKDEADEGLEPVAMAAMHRMASGSQVHVLSA